MVKMKIHNFLPKNIEKNLEIAEFSVNGQMYMSSALQIGKESKMWCSNW